MTFLAPACVIVLLTFKCFTQRPCACAQRSCCCARLLTMLRYSPGPAEEHSSSGVSLRGAVNGQLGTPLLAGEGSLSLAQCVELDDASRFAGTPVPPASPPARGKQLVSSMIQIAYLVALVVLGDFVLVLFMTKNEGNAPQAEPVSTP